MIWGNVHTASPPILLTQTGKAADTSVTLPVPLKADIMPGIGSSRSLLKRCRPCACVCCAACAVNEIKTLSWTEGAVICSVAVASLGLAATYVVTAVFWKHNNTPVVKASTRELSYIILMGLALAYAATFALVAKPRPSACAAAGILPGVAFACVYGALLTKTNRIARILAGSKKKIITRKLRFMSATAQVPMKQSKRKAGEQKYFGCRSGDKSRVPEALNSLLKLMTFHVLQRLF